MKGIVVHELQIVYWPVPKNACTSMKVYLANLIDIPFTDPHRARFEWTAEKIHGYTDIALVRNPYARLWSLYKCWDDNHSRVVYGKYGDLFRKGMPWDEYVDAIISVDRPDRHFRIQSQQIPQGCKVEKMENSTLLYLFGKHNYTGASIDFPKDERIYRHYIEDFERFEYER